MIVDIEEQRSLAAEYVLGTLELNERKAFERRLVQEPALRVELRFWEQKLSPLNQVASPVQPSVQVWDKILTNVFTSNAAKRSAWMPLALAASIAMVAVTGGIAWNLNQTQTIPADLVAVVETTDNQPGWLVKINLENNTIAMEALTQQSIPAGKSLELWVLYNDGTPKSLGLIPTKLEKRGLPKAIDMQQSSGTIAVSLEPFGGSSTGSPTGPVLYTAPVHNSGI